MLTSDLRISICFSTIKHLGDAKIANLCNSEEDTSGENMYFNPWQFTLKWWFCQKNVF